LAMRERTAISRSHHAQAG